MMKVKGCIYYRLKRTEIRYFKAATLKSRIMTIETYKSRNQWAPGQCSWCYRYMEPMDIISFIQDVDDKSYILCDLCLEALKNQGEIEFDYDPYLKDED